MQRGLTNQQEKQTTEQKNEPKDINKQFKQRKKKSKWQAYIFKTSPTH